MATADERYATVHAVWSSVTVPPITRIEAERAARGLYRHFGGVGFGGPHMDAAARFNGKVRRCWISPRTNAGLNKGWQRLVHDVSHRIFALRHPSFRPHDGGHATLEREMAQHAVQSGWLAGKLKPKVHARPTPAERRDGRIAHVQAAIARWQSKRKRAETALRKLQRQLRTLERRARQDAPSFGALPSAHREDAAVSSKI